MRLRWIWAQAVMSFHACGGNIGDTAHVSLPAWVLQVSSAHGLMISAQWSQGCLPASWKARPRAPKHGLHNYSAAQLRFSVQPPMQLDAAPCVHGQYMNACLA
jgi:hypothetical protein